MTSSMRRFTAISAVLAIAATVLAAWIAASGTARAAAPFTMGPAIKLPGADGGTEPRVAVGPDNRLWAVSNAGGGMVVYSSTNRVNWTKTATDPSGQINPTIDVDIAVTRTGRVIASELDFAGPGIFTWYSDDRGATWNRVNSTLLSALPGTQIGDQDRQWFAVGPDDPTTHLPRVYMLFHNLASGTATHNMFVLTSNDGGATFGPPIPTTIPGDQAWIDLQCADSGGPSNIAVNQKTGQVYAIFGTRSSQAGGCGASITGPFEINVVAATRVWVATAMPQDTGTPGAWKQSLAVDDNATNHIVGMQLAPGALDSAGNLSVFYPESPNAYPNYVGAALKLTRAPADLSNWSTPVTVAPAGGAGHLLPHIVAGDPGHLDVAYFEGVNQGDSPPLWFAWAAQTTDGGATFTKQRMSSIPTYQWTASEMMGACGSGPAAGVENGTACNRSTDVWGITLDLNCKVTVIWPVVGGANGPPAPPNSTANDGTYVSSQTDGSTVCASQAFPTNTTPITSAVTRPPLPNTARSTGVPGVLILAAGFVATLIALVVAGATRVRRSL
jgi:hypothetical protein